jgi:two-component system, sensor histidine kinase and response regulator
VLLVDDRPDNLLALRAVLEPLGFELVEVQSGEDALRRLLEDSASDGGDDDTEEPEFALIVLDVQMPVLDGFETARLIKGRPKTRHIPIIFLTAISGELEHHLAGYGSGAVDYVYKPFEPEILRAKVAVFGELWQRGVTISRQRRELARQVADLDAAHRSLTRITSELERSNTELERLGEVVTNEVREPLHAVAGLLDLLADRHGPGLPEEASMLLDRAIAGTGRAGEVLAQGFAVARASVGDLDGRPVPLADVVAEAETELRPLFEKAEARLVAGDLPVVAGDQRMLTQAMVGLIGHVLGNTSPQGTVRVTTGTAVGPGMARITVTSDGLSGNPAALARLFTVWGGDMGLALSRRIVERHEGRIWGEADSEGTGVICLDLPLGTVPED